MCTAIVWLHLSVCVCVLCAGLARMQRAVVSRLPHGAHACVGNRFLSVGAVRAAVDEVALLKYLGSHVPGVDWAGITVSQFTHGQSNPTYLLTSPDGKRRVLRKQPAGALLKGEFVVYTASLACWVHVPPPHTMPLAGPLCFSAQCLYVRDAGAHAVDREFKIMKALSGHVPVPNVLHLCEDR